MSSFKSLVKSALHPLRGIGTWLGQHGLLPKWLRRVLPWSWATEPFTIYGKGWRCRWVPTEFDSIGHRVFWSGLHEWEKETAPVILEQIRQSRCFADLGANCGIYTIAGCAINPTVKVLAIEPVPRIFAALKRNIEQNGLTTRVTALNVALADSDGTREFHEAEDPTMGSLEVKGYRGKSGRVIQVQCRTLDSLLAELRITPDFLKIDVEGFEHVVLAGSVMTLASIRPRLVLEVNPGDAASETAKILSDIGYCFHIITEAGPVRRDSLVPSQAYRNWLCLAP